MAQKGPNDPYSKNAPPKGFYYDIKIGGDGFVFNKLSPLGNLMGLLSKAADACYRLATSQAYLAPLAEKEKPKLNLGDAWKAVNKEKWTDSDRQLIERLTNFLAKNLLDENIKFILKFHLVVCKMFDLPYPKPPKNKTDPPVGALLTNMMGKHVNPNTATKQINIESSLRKDLLAAWEAVLQYEMANPPVYNGRGFGDGSEGGSPRPPRQHSHCGRLNSYSQNVAYVQGPKMPGAWQAFSLAHGLKETNLERWFNLKDVVLTQQASADVIRTTGTGPVVDLADVAVGGYYFVHGRPAPLA